MSRAPGWLLVASVSWVGCVHAVTAPTAAGPTLAPAAACTGAPVVTLEELENGAHANERVIVDGVPTADTRCTLMACASDRPCCNQCSGKYVLRRGERPAESLRVELDFSDAAGLGEVGCHGTECALECRPFGKAPTQAVRFVGLNTFTPKGANAVWAQSKLTVEKVCAGP